MQSRNHGGAEQPNYDAGVCVETVGKSEGVTLALAKADINATANDEWGAPPFGPDLMGHGLVVRGIRMPTLIPERVAYPDDFVETSST